MKVQNTFLYFWCVLGILSFCFASYTVAQTYSVGSQSKHWRISVDSLSSIAPDSIIRIEHPVLNADAISETARVTPLSTDETHAHIPTSVAVDTKYRVGEIPFTSEVTSTGAVTYNVPIEITPIRNGFNPEISIAYNSQGGNNVLGYGWNINGLSSITRVDKSIYYDGVTQAMTLGTDDAFVLDGMRLLPVSGQANTYEPEQGNMRIKANVSGNTINSFAVEYPNGSKAIYSNTNNISFPIIRFEDAQGNYNTYEYETVDNHSYITKIYSGIHSSSDMYFTEMDFTYKSRTDIISGYQNGMEFKLSRLLDKIKCWDKGSCVCEYTFTYQTDRVSLLTGIGKSNLNPLKFYYGYSDNTTKKLQKQEVGLMLHYDESLPVVVNKGKFDYGSDDDGLIVYPDKSPCSSYYKSSGTFQHSEYYYYSEFAPEQELLIYQNLGSVAPSPTKLLAEDGFQALLSADVDGKAGDEILKINNTLANDRDVVTIKTYKPDLKNSMSLESTFTFTSDAVTHVNNKSFWPKTYLSGDYNGDGKIEILAVSMYQPLEKELDSKCMLFDLSGRRTLFNAHVFNFNVKKDMVIPMDVDGDGKTDICHLHENGLDIYSFEVAGGTYSLNKLFTYPDLDIYSLRDRNLMLGDVNGDGKIDLVVTPVKSYYEWGNLDVLTKTSEYCPRCLWHYPNSNVCPECHYFIGYVTECVNCRKPLANGECPKHGATYRVATTIPYHNGTLWDVYLSKGNGFIKTQQNLMECKKDEHYALQDVDADGLVDLVKQGLYYNTYSIDALLNKNGSFLIDIISVGIPDGSYMVPSSVATSNYYNFLLAVKGSKLVKVNSMINGAKQYLLTGMVNSLGVIHRNYYQRLNGRELGNPIWFYVKGTNATFPYTDFNGPLWATASQETLLNGSLINNLSYTYKGAIFHRQGLGFVGMKEVEVYDKLRSRVVSSQTYDPLRFGVPVKETTPTMETSHIYYVGVATNKKTTVRPTQVTVKDLLKNVTVTTTYSYDNYSNPVSEVTAYTDGQTSNVIQTNVTQTYQNQITTDRYLIGLPVLKTVTERRDGASWTQSEEITYKSGTILPESKITKANGNKTDETRWTYDAYNNVLTEMSAPYESVVFQGSTYTYYMNRDLESETDRLGRTTRYSYDTWGRVSSMTDFLSNIYHYSYNGDHLWQVRLFNRNSATRYDMKKEVTYVWSPSIGVYSVTESIAGQPQKETYYDALNREVWSGSQRFDGSWQYTATEYDEYGRLKRVSQPFKTQPSLWTTYSYDSYDRTISVTEASGGTNTTAYSGNQVTTTDARGIATTRTYDKSGLLAAVSDPGGTITYEYRPDKQPTKIVAPGDIVTSFEYDAYGRRTKLIDPSAGTQTYSENVSGSQRDVRETDANGKTILSNFKLDGRIVRAVRPEFETRWKYNITTKLIEKEISTNGTSKYYTYDKLGRIATETEYAPDSVWLKRSYTYNTDDNLTKIIYETSDDNSLIEENHIYTNGHLTEIKLGSTSVWKLVGENELGQPTVVTTGLLTRTYGYDAYGMETERKAGSIQHFKYMFNARTGNLSTRTDVDRNITEYFTYDKLNRLVDYGPKQNVYDSKGNITQLVGVGELSYTNTSKPYAVTEFVSHSGYLAPKNPQNVIYTSFKRPATIMENGATATFIYKANGDRAKMTISRNGNNKQCRYYLGGCYEKDGAKSFLYIGGNAYSAPAVYVREHGSWSIYYICRDYLGSITHITNSTGNVVQELSYDAWGRWRNPDNQSIYAPGAEPDLFLNRGYTGHEHLSMFGLVNMNARLYDLLLGRFLSPDPYVQMPENSQSFNRYSYCLNNPLMYRDQTGEIAWFVPVIIGAVVGAYVGASIQSHTAAFWDWKPDCWKGAIAGGVIGATLGYGFSAAIGATGMTTTAAGVSVPTKAAGLVSTMLNSGSINIGMNAISGGGWDGAWKSGLVGMASGAWTATGGLGMVKGFGSTSNIGQLSGKLGYEMIGTAGRSIGKNWAQGSDPFSKVSLGIGPVNLTLGKGQKLLQWQNNLGNIVTNASGLINMAFGGDISFDWKNLSLNYSGGAVNYFYSRDVDSGYGAHAIIGNSNLNKVYSHELHHLWQSRSMGDAFLPNYLMHGLHSVALHGSLISIQNFFETQAETKYWW